MFLADLLLIPGGRHSGNPLEDIVELWNRPESRGEDHIGDSQAKIKQQDFGLFHTDAGYIFGQCDARGLFEHLTEMEAACMDML